MTRTVRAGLVLFAVGLAFLAVDVVPFFFGAHDRPLWLNLACLAVPAGLVVAISGAVSRGRAEQRRALEQLR